MQNPKTQRLLKFRTFKPSLPMTHFPFLITPLALALSGCMGVYEGGFECPAGEGMKCKSISEVNQMVNQCAVSSAQCLVSSIQSPENEENSEIWYSPFFESQPKEQRNFGRSNGSISL